MKRDLSKPLAPTWPKEAKGKSLSKTKTANIKPNPTGEQRAAVNKANKKFNNLDSHLDEKLQRKKEKAARGFAAATVISSVALMGKAIKNKIDSSRGY